MKRHDPLVRRVRTNSSSNPRADASPFSRRLRCCTQAEDKLAIVTVCGGCPTNMPRVQSPPPPMGGPTSKSPPKKKTNRCAPVGPSSV